MDGEVGVVALLEIDVVVVSWSADCDQVEVDGLLRLGHDGFGLWGGRNPEVCNWGGAGAGLEYVNGIQFTDVLIAIKFEGSVFRHLSTIFRLSMNICFLINFNESPSKFNNEVICNHGVYGASGVSCLELGTNTPAAPSSDARPVKPNTLLTYLS